MKTINCSEARTDDGLRYSAVPSSHVYTAGCHGADAEMVEMVMLRAATGHSLIISALKVSTWTGCKIL